MKEPYKLIEHSGDAGIIAYGRTKPELFVNAAKGMFDLFVESDTIEAKKSREIELNGEDPEDLLVRWLSELNYMVNTYREVYSKFTIERLTDTHICGAAIGEAIDSKRHNIITEIKAVTYHEIYLMERSFGFEARVIFDL